MALGLISFAIGLFGNVPCPIIYGAVVDSACLFWEDNCGEPGACRVYDPTKFRTYFHGLTAIIMFAAFLVDVIVWVKAKKIQVHEDQQSHKEGSHLGSRTIVHPEYHEHEQKSPSIYPSRDLTIGEDSDMKERQEDGKPGNGLSLGFNDGSQGVDLVLNHNYRNNLQPISAHQIALKRQPQEDKESQPRL